MKTPFYTVIYRKNADTNKKAAQAIKKNGTSDAKKNGTSERLTKIHPFLIGKPSINGPFPMAMLNNQRVTGPYQVAPKNANFFQFPPVGDCGHPLPGGPIVAQVVHLCSEATALLHGSRLKNGEPRLSRAGKNAFFCLKKKTDVVLCFPKLLWNFLVFDLYFWNPERKTRVLNDFE